MQDGAVGADGGGGAVGVEDEFPPPAVDGYEVMKRAREAAVLQRGRAAFGPGCQVMDVAGGGAAVAAGEAAVLVALVCLGVATVILLRRDGPKLLRRLMVKIRAGAGRPDGP